LEAAVGFEVKEIQPTPNPNALKFVLDGTVSAQPASFFKPEQAKDHALGAKLMAVAGVSHVMLLSDFVTIGKQPQARWSDIKKTVTQILASHEPK
jgi:NFU1 iron-sulfur cluster scaffold homolog, mitochondrial